MSQRERDIWIGLMVGATMATILCFIIALVITFVNP